MLLAYLVAGGLVALSIALFVLLFFLVRPSGDPPEAAEPPGDPR